MYDHDMDVAVSVLRAELSSWLDRVRAGEEIVVTERGVPVARLSPIASASRVDELGRAGVLSKTQDKAQGSDHWHVHIAKRQRPRFRQRAC